MTLDIHITHLRAGHKLLVQNLHVHCAPGQLVTLMGASGSGKSSLLAAVCGTLETTVPGIPTSDISSSITLNHNRPYRGMEFAGDILLDGKSVAALPCAQRGIGMLFQDDLLFDHMTVHDNLLFAVPAGPKKQRATAVQAALDELGFADMAHRSPSTLSGGQRARVSLLRTLLAKPRALLLDEPFSKLDAALRQQFREFVFTHVRQYALPTLLVTHDAADVADSGAVVHL
jgi:putative thiamine transport system ATP-binding protein